MDNAHAVKQPKKNGFSGRRRDYDHVHMSVCDKGTPYDFVDCATLMNDFFSGFDETIETIEAK